MQLRRFLANLGHGCGGAQLSEPRGPTTVEMSATATSPGVGVSPILDAEENEWFSSLALFLVLFLLIGSFLTSYYLKVKRITAVHETIVGLFAGTWKANAQACLLASSYASMC